jgi:DNA-binding NarL/FixJ family response regulator
MNTSAHCRQPGHSYPRGPSGNGSPVRALIVDDSPSILKKLASLLEQQIDVQLIGSATDGHGAMRRMLELNPDLVLLDSQLPGINGLEVTRQIKARPQAPAVILVTADDTPECHAAARAAGTDGVVGKQHLSTQLRPVIRKLFPAKRNAEHRNQADRPHNHKPNPR